MKGGEGNQLTDSDKEDELSSRRIKGRRVKSVVQTDGANPDMPHRIECPLDIQQFELLVDKYVINPQLDLVALVDRIVIWNSIHLPGQQGVANRSVMHNFVDILLKFVVKIGNDLTSSESFYSIEEVNICITFLF